MSQRADALRDNDTRLVEYLQSLTEAQWNHPSLCAEWTTHDVVAHLVIGYSATLSSIAAATLRHRGSFDPANADMARTLAAQRDPHALVEGFIALTRHARGVGRVFPRRLLLGDHVIHELDITCALGADSTIPAPVLAAVLNTATQIPNPFVPARARARGLNLIATDTSWSRRTDGLTVNGQADHLVSVLAGRPWALQHLTGDGVPVLHSRIQPTPEARRDAP